MSTCKYLNARLQCEAKTICPYNTKAIQYFWQPISRPAETTFSRIRCVKSEEIRLCLLCCGGCREERNLLYILKIWNNVFSHWSFGGLPKRYCGPPIFCHCPAAPWGAMWPTLKTTEWVNTRRRVRNFVINLFICCVFNDVCNCCMTRDNFLYWILRLDWTEFERKRLWPILRWSFDLWLKFFTLRVFLLWGFSTLAEVFLLWQVFLTLTEVFLTLTEGFLLWLRFFLLWGSSTLTEVFLTLAELFLTLSFFVLWCFSYSEGFLLWLRFFLNLTEVFLLWLRFFLLWGFSYSDWGFSYSDWGFCYSDWCFSYSEVFILWLRFFLLWLRFFLLWLRFFLFWLRFFLLWLRFFLLWLRFFYSDWGFYYSDWGFYYSDWGFSYPDWGFSVLFPQL